MRSRRFAWQVLLLPVLYALSIPDSVLFANLVSALLIGVFFLAWAVALVLDWAASQAAKPDPESGRPRGRVDALDEARDNAYTRALISSGAAVAGMISLAFNLLGVTIPGRPFVAVLAWVLLLNAVPSLGWAQRWQGYWVPLLRERWARWRGAR